MRNQFKEIKRYVVYYGRSVQKEYFKNYDALILEAAGWEKEELEQFKADGKIIIAYISAMEMPIVANFCELLKDEDFLSQGGIRLKNYEYDNFFIDISKRRWQSIFVHTAGELLYNKNFDGLFIDTLGDIEFSIFDEAIRTKLLYGARTLIEAVRVIFDDKIIIQNNGLGKVIDFTIDFLDGVCWENPVLNTKENMIYSENLLSKMKIFQNERDIKLLLLTDGSVNSSKLNTLIKKVYNYEDLTTKVLTHNNVKNYLSV